jgi:hypothetical protein
MEFEILFDRIFSKVVLEIIFSKSLVFDIVIYIGRYILLLINYSDIL